MKIIGRIFICIWTVIYTLSVVLGGFIIYPIINYIIYGELDDMFEVSLNIFERGKYLIEDFFDNIKFNKCNDKFWK